MRAPLLLFLAGAIGASSTASDSSRAQTAAIYRAVVQHFLKDLPKKSRLACVGLGDGLPAQNSTDPPADLLRQLTPSDGTVEPASACKDEEDAGFRVRGQRRHGGMILTFGKIDWQPSGRATVPVTYCCWPGWGRAELERKEGTWRVLWLLEWVQT